MSDKLPAYSLGVVDGFELALRIHRKHFGSVPKDWTAVRRALRGFGGDVQHAIDMIQTHRLGDTAAFFGFDAGWTPERAERLRGLYPLEVEVDEARDGSGDVKP